MTRHIDFEGIENFRDFGGYDTAHGRPLKRGLLYRSANHAYATEADLKRMRDLGVAAIIDLRRPDERSREPSKRWADFGAEVVENDIASAHPDWAETMKGATLSAQWFLDDGVNYYRRGPFEPRHVDLWSRYFLTLAQVPGADCRALRGGQGPHGDDLRAHPPHHGCPSRRHHGRLPRDQ
jgi:protein tyrosine/serine phosphatase